MYKTISYPSPPFFNYIFKNTILHKMMWIKVKYGQFPIVYATRQVF